MSLESTVACQIKKKINLMKLNTLITNNLWYHGSNHDFKKFDKQYKTIVDAKRYNPIFFSRNKNFAALYGKIIYTVTLNTKKTFNHMDLFINITPGHSGWDNIDNLSEYGLELYNRIEKSNKNIDPYDTLEYISTESWDVMESDIMQSFLEEYEYDSFYVKGDGERNIGIIDLSTINIINKANTNNG